jgi:hypothetical protein
MFMLIGTMKNSAMYLLYEYDVNLFISLCCENKARPQLHCNGKCKLAKMQKEQQEDDAAKTLKQLQADSLFSFQLTYTLIPVLHHCEDKREYCIYNKQLPSFLYVTRNDKPPESVTAI